MIEPSIILNKTSDTKPVNFIRSYSCKIPFDIIKDKDKYIYSLMLFNSLTEYNQYQMEQNSISRDKEINELKEKNSELEAKLKELDIVPTLPSRITANEEAISMSEETINSIMTEVIPSLMV